MPDKTISELLSTPKGRKPWYASVYLPIIQWIQTHNTAISGLQGSPQLTGNMATAIDTRWSAVTGGTGNAFTFTPSVTLDARADNMWFMLEFDRSNTGSATINDGLGSVPLRRPDGSALQSGDVFSGLRRIIAWDADNSYYRFTGQMAQAAEPPVIPVIDVTSSPFTVDASHQGRTLYVDAGTGNRDIQLPDIAGVGDGFPLVVYVKDATNTITIKRNTTSPADTIDGSATDMILTSAKDYVFLVSDEDNEDWLLLDDRRDPLIVNATTSANEGATSGTRTVIFNTEARDPRSIYNNTNGQITIPEDGVYLITVSGTIVNTSVNCVFYFKSIDNSTSPQTTTTFLGDQSGGGTGDRIGFGGISRWWASGIIIECQIFSATAQQLEAGAELQVIKLP